MSEDDSHLWMSDNDSEDKQSEDKNSDEKSSEDDMTISSCLSVCF